MKWESSILENDALSLLIIFVKILNFIVVLQGLGDFIGIVPMKHYDLLYYWMPPTTSPLQSAKYSRITLEYLELERFNAFYGKKTDSHGRLEKY